MVVPGENIGFEIESRSFVTMKVHDASGKLVSFLVDGQFGPGKQSVPFESAVLTKGPFFIQFRARSMIGNPEK